MGWKGTLRSVRAEIRRAEKRQIQYEKQVQAEKARELVENQNNYLERIKTFHKMFVQRTDWNVFAKATEPVPPEQKFVRETSAIFKYENYSPNFLIRLFRLHSWRKSLLKKRIAKARLQDEEENRTLRSQFEAEHNQWKRDKDLAEKIFKNDINAYEKVLSSKSVLKDGSIICSAIRLCFNDGVLNVEIDILREEEVLPNTIYSVTKTGKISEKDFPKTQYNQLYQDYTCSVSLAVAKMLFGWFPVDKILVHAMVDLLNTSTGNLERQPVLSVFIPRESMWNLNFNQIDPSDCMKNFNHNMNYKNSEGFKPTTQLKIGKGQAS
ncbi:hypothetical protein QJS83_00535 [Bdellovibrio sp. 22V]|uniref:hypothetical protein n=1 Tax=Bdellovibrio sp. 22V TaxID=3044166 RepID=UPI0025435767|nr:hypothetical protein [Bdellovibrio sp. 22V]WII72351.1 hypothetical protein QJS83_00535 [Bdellovibrio sp. 22V]